MGIPLETLTVTPVSAGLVRVTAVVGKMDHVIPEDVPVWFTEKEPPPTNVCGPGFKKAGFPRVFVIVNVTGLDATPFGL
jgi:hypothetical protein